VLQELAALTGAWVWAVASMIFFLLVFVAVVVQVWRTRPEVAESCARLPLEDDDPPAPGRKHSDSIEG
jgi:hypothetical protein